MPAFLENKIYNGMSVLMLTVEIRPHHFVYGCVMPIFLIAAAEKKR